MREIHTPSETPLLSGIFRVFDLRPINFQYVQLLCRCCCHYHIVIRNELAVSYFQIIISGEPGKREGRSRAAQLRKETGWT